MTDPVRQEVIALAHTIVVKVGTSVLTRPDGTLNRRRITTLARELCEVLATGRRLVLVSSGAIGAGVGVLRLRGRPGDLRHQQAAAAVGQNFLMQAYDQALRRHGYRAAQILLTADDFHDRTRYLNVRNTILTLFEYNAVPIINENDTVSVNELRFGDNDTLAGMVTNLLQAPLLIILSVVEGLYGADPSHGRRRGGGRSAQPPAARPTVIPTVTRIDDSVLQLAGTGRSRWGTGGMVAKLEAARMCTVAGESVLIADGRRCGVLRRVLAGQRVGTLFLPHGGTLTARKRWIGYTARPKGHYVTDPGARRAVEERGKSLLAIGIVGVVGSFNKGDVVRICDATGEEFARGLTNFSADEARRIMGLRTSQVQALLGSPPYDEVVHRDNLVVTTRSRC